MTTNIIDGCSYNSHWLKRLAAISSTFQHMDQPKHNLSSDVTAMVYKKKQRIPAK